LPCRRPSRSAPASKPLASKTISGYFLASRKSLSRTWRSRASWLLNTLSAATTTLPDFNVRAASSYSKRPLAFRNRPMMSA